MKKLLFTLLFAGSLALSACGATVYKAENSKSKLEKNGYSVELYNNSDAKTHIVGLKLDGYNFNAAIYAQKGSGDDKDIFLGFYFASIDDASKFVEDNNNENLGLLNTFGEGVLGKNLTKKVGTHNNVAYVGSETSFSNAF